MSGKPSQPEPPVPESSSSAPLPGWVLAGLIVLGLVLTLWGQLGSFPALIGAIAAVLTDGIMAVLVLVAATGYGYGLYRWIIPPATPRLLSLATAAVVGLWLLSTVMLLVGSAIGGLSPWVWWPVVAAGVALAAAQAYRPLGRMKLPDGLSGAALVWAVVAVAAGVWLAGALLPPGWLGRLTADNYDILEYHLQLPREYFQAGAVQTLEHNAYSHYPLGMEMLFLLAMCLRGGAYEGVYLAQLMPGLFGVAAVVGVFGALRGTAVQPVEMGLSFQRVPGEDFRARAAVLLLATAPWVLYLSWLPMPELGEIACLALSLAWLRQWLANRTLRSAAWIGVLLGVACALKYLSVGLIAAPVLAAMLTAGVARRRRLRHAAGPDAAPPASGIGQAAFAAAVAMACFVPWLARNYAATANPVFPLATGVFGQGHWSDEQAQRWRDGHAPGQHPPVPVPPGYAPPPAGPSPLARLGAWLIGAAPYRDVPPIGWATLLPALGALVALLLRRRGGAWEWALAGVIAMQLAAWMLCTHDMPARFISVVIAPLTLLAAGGISWLAEIRELRWLRQTASGNRPWGIAPAVLLLIATVLINLLSARFYYRTDSDYGRPEVVRPAGVPVELFAQTPAETLGPRPRLLLVGEGAAFYLPADTVYATVFDEQPLSQILRLAKDRELSLSAVLRDAGITHVQVHWAEIHRLAISYGWPVELRPERLGEIFGGWPVAQEVGGEGRPPPVTIYAVPAK